MRARVLGVLLIVLLAAPPAHAATADEKLANQVFTDYTKDGRIDPCDYSTADLETALDNVPPNVVQYASDYPAAIRQALRFRARGGCDEDAAAPAAPSTPGAAAPAPGTPGAAPPADGGAAAPLPPVATAPGEPPAPGTNVPPATAGDPADTSVERAAAAAPDNAAPAPLVGLGLLAVLLALTAAMLLAIRRLGQGEGRLAPAYHSWREARWRAGGVWADFRDWLSLGR